MSIKKSPSLLNIKKKVDFLFVSYGGGHLKAILPVANQLIKDGYSIKIFALTTAINDLIDSNIPYFSYKDLPEAYEEENIKLGIKLAKHLDIQNNKDNIVSYEESVAYLALNYKDLIRLYGQSKGRKMWLEEGRQIFYPIYLMKKVLNYIEPKIVISTNSPRSEKAAIRAASMLNIKSVCINDLFAIQESAWLKDNSFANKIFVLNDSVKKFLVGLGRAAEDIVVSGNPAFDSLFEKKFIDESNFIKEEFKLNNKLSILYASTIENKINTWTGEKGDVDLPKKIERALRRYVRTNDQVNLIIRRHPNQNQDVLIEDRVFHSEQSQNINSVLHAVDVVIHSASTVGLQAGIIGKSVINVELSTIANDLPLTSMGIGVSLFNLNDLEKVINIATEEPLKNNKNNKPNSNAKDIIVREIYSLIDCSN